MSLLESLRRLILPSIKSRDVWSATTQVLRRMISASPSCNAALDGHAYSQVAEAGNECDMRRLFEAIELRDWTGLACIHSFDVAKNAVIATAIRCPKRSGSVLPYVDYAELYGDSEMGTAVVLTKEEWQHLNESAPAPLCWHDF